MTKTERKARIKLMAYACHFLKVVARPDEAICATPESIAAFAAQLRDGCKQDLLRLIAQVRDDTHGRTAEDALDALAISISEGETIELWGLPDCGCGREDCAYCGRGLATTPVLSGE